MSHERPLRCRQWSHHTLRWTHHTSQMYDARTACIVHFTLKLFFSTRNSDVTQKLSLARIANIETNLIIRSCHRTCWQKVVNTVIITHHQSCYWQTIRRLFTALASISRHQRCSSRQMIRYTIYHLVPVPRYEYGVLTICRTLYWLLVLHANYRLVLHVLISRGFSTCYARERESQPTYINFVLRLYQRCRKSLKTLRYRMLLFLPKKNQKQKKLQQCCSARYFKLKEMSYHSTLLQNKINVYTATILTRSLKPEQKKKKKTQPFALFLSAAFVSGCFCLFLCMHYSLAHALALQISFVLSARKPVSYSNSVY